MKKYLFLSLILVAPSIAFADETPQEWSLHAQGTTISQGRAAIASPYSSANSLSAASEYRTSYTTTGFIGHTLWSDAAIFINPEVSGGSGLSSTHGVAAFPNGEIYRVDNPSPKGNLSRLFLQQIIPLGNEREFLEDDLNRIATSVAKSRITFVLGKFSLNDYFDDNSYSHDPRTQFMNWSLMDNGAWDYAADTRGYTIGAYAELNQERWALRFAHVMEPKYANQLELDKNISSAYADNLEFEERHRIGEHEGKLRILSYLNHANMGNYRNTINTPAYGMDLTLSRSYSKKYGFGLNLEQEIASGLGVFSRLGWDDGHTETWTFTEVDRTLSLGLSLNGKYWNRKNDTVGIAYILNGLSQDHRDYLAAGGSGFLIGDGKLNYDLEKVVESYYLWKPIKELGLSADSQLVSNPAYNKDRGPAFIIAARLHVEI